MNHYQIAIELATEVVRFCFPYAFVFGFTGLLVRSALRMMLGGEFRLK